MAKEQFNPSTQKVLFNPATQKVLMVAADCEACAAFGKDTPQYAQVTLSGILSCPGLDCCEGTPKFRLTSYGIGWNGVYILEQGRVTNVGNYPVWESAQVRPCSWSAMINDDFGGFDLYNLDGCLGGVAAHYDFDWLVIRTYMHMDVPETIRRFDMTAFLVASGSVHWYQIFLKTGFIATPYPDCIPYNVNISNDFTCVGDPMPCWGQGTFKFAEWPPP